MWWTVSILSLKERNARTTEVILGVWDEEDHVKWLQENPTKQPKPRSTRRYSLVWILNVPTVERYSFHCLLLLFHLSSFQPLSALLRYWWHLWSDGQKKIYRGETKVSIFLPIYFRNAKFHSECRDVVGGVFVDNAGPATQPRFNTTISLFPWQVSFCSGFSACSLKILFNFRCKENPKQPHSISIYLVEPQPCEYLLVVSAHATHQLKFTLFKEKREWSDSWSDTETKQFCSACRLSPNCSVILWGRVMMLPVSCRFLEQ